MRKLTLLFLLVALSTKGQVLIEAGVIRSTVADSTASAVTNHPSEWGSIIYNTQKGRWQFYDGAIGSYIDLYQPSSGGGGGSISGLTSGRLTYGTSSTTIGSASGLQWDAGNSRFYIGATTGQTIGGSGGPPTLQLFGTSAVTAQSSTMRFSADAGGSRFILAKSRNAAIGSHTIVQSGDVVGILSFAADDGVDYTGRTSEIRSEIDGTPGSSDLPGRLILATTPDGSDVPTDRFKIDNAGKLSILTTPTHNDTVTTILGLRQSTGEVVYRKSTSLITVPGSTGQLLYNNGGALAANANMTFTGGNQLNANKLNIATTSTFNGDVQGGTATFSSLVDIKNLTVDLALKNTALTSGRVAIVGTAGLVTDDAGMTYNAAGDDLTIADDVNAAGLVSSDLTSGRFALVGTSGRVSDDADLIYGSDYGSFKGIGIGTAPYQGGLFGGIAENNNGDLNIIGGAGDGGGTTGHDLKLWGGNGHNSGNTGGGDVWIVPGTPNGTGFSGNVLIGTGGFTASSAAKTFEMRMSKVDIISGASTTVTSSDNIDLAAADEITLSPGSGTGNGVKINTGIQSTGTGLKHGRVTTGSITAGNLAIVTLTFSGTAFADTNYTVSATVEQSGTLTPTLIVDHITAKATNSVSIMVVNNGLASATGTLNVIAIHD